MDNEIASAPGPMPYFIDIIDFLRGQPLLVPSFRTGFVPSKRDNEKEGTRHRTSAPDPHALRIFDSTHRVRAVLDPKEGERSGGNAPLSASDSGGPPRAESGVLFPSPTPRNLPRSPAKKIPKGTKIPTAYPALPQMLTLPPPYPPHSVLADRDWQPPPDSG